MIRVLSFDGFTIQGQYTGYLVASTEAMGRAANPIALEVIGGFPRSEGHQEASATFQVGIIIDTTDLTAAVETLKAAFRAGRRGALVVDNDGEEMARDAQVTGVFPYAGAPNRFVISFFAADPRWRGTSTEEVTEEVTEDGGTFVSTNAGNAVDDGVVIRVQPTAQKDPTKAWQERHFVTLVNRRPVGLGDFPIDLTDGGYDHAADVSGGDSQADGDDIRVLVDGREIPRYFGEHSSHDANDDETTIWATPLVAAGVTAQLHSAITDSSPADGEDLEVEPEGTAGFPTWGALRVESGEVITYTGTTPRNANGRAAFTGIKRGQRGTAAASASAGDDVQLVARKVEIIKGHTGIGAPDPRPDQKPILDLTSATLSNTQHEWVKFYDDLYPSRPGQWARRLELRDPQAGFVYLASGESGAVGPVNFRYAYAEPSGDNYNVLRRAFPTGTPHAPAGQVAFDYDLDAGMSLRVLVTDEDGIEHDVIGHRIRGPEEDSFASSLAERHYEVALYARSQVTHSVPETPGAPLSLSNALPVTIAAANASGSVVQPVSNTADEPMLVYGVGLLVAMATPHEDIDVDIAIQDEDDNLIQVMTAEIPDSDMPTTAAWRYAFFTLPVTLMPGESFFLQVRVSGTHGNAFWYARRTAMDGSYPVHGYRLLADGQQEEHARPRDGDSAEVDNLVVKLHPDGVPIVEMQDAEECYWLNEEIVNETTGQRVKFDLIIGPDDEIEIDCGNHTARNLTTGEDVSYGVELSDASAWIQRAPGSNTFRVDGDGIEGLQVTVSGYARYE